jgi:hypothetical protein
VLTQRQSRDSLSEDRIARLESLNGWRWNAIDDLWNDSYQALMAYAAQYGHARPPRSVETTNGVVLGSWIQTQRTNKDSLSQDRIALLESLKGWSWDPFADQWNDGYQALTEYVAQTGHAQPPQTLKNPDGLVLGRWVHKQRQNRESLSQDRIALLESLTGWSWDPFADQWNDGYQTLTEYVAQTGHARPHYDYTTTEKFRLGSWVYSQRATRSSLTPNRIALLESLQGWSWDAREDKWIRAYEALTEYVAQTGHARPLHSFKTIDGIGLGHWVHTQRQNRDSMSKERIGLLESLKGWSWGSKLKQTPKDTPSS